MSQPRLAVLCDYAEENWPSMELVGDMLIERTGAARIQPRFRGYSGWRNADRLLNRFVTYPLAARRQGAFDVFHVIDHSYAHLVHALPAHRTVVTCHDTDTFRCLLDPAREPRPLWFRAMARHILRGLQKAARIVCVSEATRAQLQHHALVDPARIQVIHNGVHPAYTAEPEKTWDRAAAHLLGPTAGRTELLHVGSTIPRKRIDLLLQVFAECVRDHPRLHLVRVGAPFTPQQKQMASQLDIAERITHLGNLPPKLLAAVYRRAALLLLPSEAEGFGLPVVEAMSCGTPVIASNIPSLLEVGGKALITYPFGDITQWSQGVRETLEKRASNADFWYQRTAVCREQASLFSWDRNARELVALYRTLLAQSQIGRQSSWEK